MEFKRFKQPQWLTQELLSDAFTAQEMLRKSLLLEDISMVNSPLNVRDISSETTSGRLFQTSKKPRPPAPFAWWIINTSTVLVVSQETHRTKPTWTDLSKSSTLRISKLDGKSLTWLSQLLDVTLAACQWKKIRFSFLEGGIKVHWRVPTSSAETVEISRALSVTLDSMAVVHSFHTILKPCQVAASSTKQISS